MNLFQKFLIDIVRRFTAKTPWFFKVLQVVAAGVALIFVLPDIVSAIRQGGFVLPASWDEMVTKLVGYAAVWQVFILQLTATSEDKKEKGIKD